jgi:hypothetical protein
LLQYIEPIGAYVTHIEGHLKQRLDLDSGASCDIEKMREVTARSSREPFRNVAHRRDRRPSNLVSQRVIPLKLARAGRLIDFAYELTRLLPGLNVQIFGSLPWGAQP